MAYLTAASGPALRPPTLPFDEYRGLFSLGIMLLRRAADHLLPRLRMCGALPPPLLHIPSWCDFLIKYSYNLSRGSSVGIATGTGWAVRGSNPGAGEIFRARPDRPTQPPLQWVLGLSRG